MFRTIQTVRAVQILCMSILSSVCLQTSGNCLDSWGSIYWPPQVQHQGGSPWIYRVFVPKYDARYQQFGVTNTLLDNSDLGHPPMTVFKSLANEVRSASPKMQKFYFKTNAPWAIGDSSSQPAWLGRAPVAVGEPLFKCVKLEPETSSRKWTQKYEDRVFEGYPEQEVLEADFFTDADSYRDYSNRCVLYKDLPLGTYEVRVPYYWAYDIPFDHNLLEGDLQNHIKRIDYLQKERVQGSRYIRVAPNAKEYTYGRSIELENAPIAGVSSKALAASLREYAKARAIANLVDIPQAELARVIKEHTECVLEEQLKLSRRAARKVAAKIALKYATEAFAAFLALAEQQVEWKNINKGITLRYVRRWNERLYEFTDSRATVPDITTHAGGMVSYGQIEAVRYDLVTVTGSGIVRPYREVRPVETLYFGSIIDREYSTVDSISAIVEEGYQMGTPEAVQGLKWYYKTEESKTILAHRVALEAMPQFQGAHPALMLARRPAIMPPTLDSAVRTALEEWKYWHSHLPPDMYSANTWLREYHFKPVE